MQSARNSLIQQDPWRLSGGRDDARFFPAASRAFSSRSEGLAGYAMPKYQGEPSTAPAGCIHGEPASARRAAPHALCCRTPHSTNVAPAPPLNTPGLHPGVKAAVLNQRQATFWHSRCGVACAQALPLAPSRALLPSSAALGGGPAPRIPGPRCASLRLIFAWCSLITAPRL